MSLYDGYDQYYAEHLSPVQLGGVNRAKTARRDAQGRFMPKAEWRQDLWELDENHGQAGARERWRRWREKHSANT